MHVRRFAGALAVLTVLAAAACAPPTGGGDPDSGQDPVPWWCTATAWGPGHGHHYDGQTKGNLSEADCGSVTAALDAARSYALQYPTAADARAAGFERFVPYVSGMGTHDAAVPGLAEAIAHPDFDRSDPIFPGTALDDVFDPTTPEFLQYEGNGLDAELVGMSWLVRTDNGMPPEGFAGGNDWWHSHPVLCFSTSYGVVIGENLSEPSCSGSGGVNLYLQDYWMVHAWIVPGMEYRIDVFENHHPCLTSAGPIWDQDDPCFDEAPTGGGH
jgi:hypothetical protein